MGRALYESQPVFRAALGRCAELLAPELDRPLLSLLDPQAGSLLDQTGYTQPVLFALEYALATLWQSWGIEPAAVLGHSVGEFVAACVAGVYSLQDGIRLIAQRARLMQALPSGGCMAAVFAAEQQVTAALETYRRREGGRHPPCDGSDEELGVAWGVRLPLSRDRHRRAERAGEHRHFRRRLGGQRSSGRAGKSRHQVEAAGNLARLPLAADGSDAGRLAASRGGGGLFQTEDRHRCQPDGQR